MPVVTATPSTVAITLGCMPALVRVLAAVIATVKVWLSLASRALAVKRGCVKAEPS